MLPSRLSGVDEGDTDWSNAHANFLANLSLEERLDLLRKSTLLSLKPRDNLFRAGDESDYVYIVEEGCIRLSKLTSTGKETILWFNFPGELLGIAELWSLLPRQVHAVANESSQVHCIRRDDFVEFLGLHPEAAMKAMGILSARVRALGHALVGLTTDDVQTRITKLLMRFGSLRPDNACPIEPVEGELCVWIRLTHQDIGNLIGASRQTVTTALAGLRKSGVLRMVHQHIHILKPDHL